MRRYLALFLTLYIMALTVQPCVDRDLKCPDMRLQQVHAACPADESAADQHDGCSPFCTCSCCSISMAVSAPTLLPPVTTLPKVITFAYISTPESLYIPPVWEPPRA